MAVDLSKRVPSMSFTNGNDVENFTVPVIDKAPELGDFHTEGRRVVEVSVELFIEFMAQQGFLPIDPATGKAAVPTNKGEVDGSN